MNPTWRSEMKTEKLLDQGEAPSPSDEADEKSSNGVQNGNVVKSPDGRSFKIITSFTVFKGLKLGLKVFQRQRAIC